MEEIQLASTKVKISKIAVSISLVVVISVVLSVPIDIIPPLGGLIDPFSGIFTVPLTGDHPPYASVYASGQLNAPVHVIRDSWGIPHIYAETDQDLFFAFGYVQAQDRLWQMDLTRRQARGQLAEILGSDYIDEDIFLRTLGMERAAQQSYELMVANTDPVNQTLMRNMEAYVAGINWYISNIGNSLPLEFKLLNYRPSPWTLIDSLAIGRILDFSLSWDTSELRFANAIIHLGNDSAWELFPLTNPLQIPVVPEYGTSWSPTPTSAEVPALPAPEYPASIQRLFSSVLDWTDNLEDPLGILSDWRQDIIGSNNWAVNSTKSATGKPILCNDMHLSRDVPAIWYQAHLVSSETDYNMYGFVPPGVPFLIAGHNEYLGWGFTNVAADVSDLYYYKTNPTDSNQYWYDGGWQNFEEEITWISVKGQNPLPVTIRRTVHGPVLSDVGITYSDYVLAQRWTGAEPSYEVIALNKMTRATNYAEFIEGQKYWWTISQNIVYADVHDTIAIRPTGRWPIRSEGYGRLPYNGSAGEGEWVDFVEFDELPLSLNPARGYVASANQLAAMYGSGGYPYYIHSFTAPGYRARRINYLLDTDELVTIRDMKNYQNDVVDTAAEAFVSYIVDAFDSAPTATQADPNLAAAVNYLRSWNFSMLQDLVAPTIWRAWFDFYQEAVFGDEYDQLVCGRGELLWPSPVILENMTRYTPNAIWFDDVTTTGVTETRDDIILAALDGAISRLILDEGADMSQWTWGRFHFVVYTHSVSSALGHGPYPADGDAVTLNPSRVDMWKKEQGASRGGPSERLIVNFADPFHAQSVIPGGQSGNPFSSHYSDQLHQLFLDGLYHIDYLYSTMEDLADRESILVLTG